MLAQSSSSECRNVDNSKAFPISSTVSLLLNEVVSDSAHLDDQNLLLRDIILPYSLYGKVYIEDLDHDLKEKLDSSPIAIYQCLNLCKERGICSDINSVASESELEQPITDPLL